MPEFLRFINPPTMEKPPGYSHVVEIKGDARIVFFAGQLGVDTSGKFVGAPGDFKAQTVQAFENLKAALEAVGANFGHLVKINNYLVDIERNMLAFREVRDRYLVRRRRPARPSASRPWPGPADCSRSKRWRHCRVREDCHPGACRRDPSINECWSKLGDGFRHKARNDNASPSVGSRVSRARPCAGS